MSLIPLTERSGIDLDNGGLGEGVGADKLVVGRVVWCFRRVSISFSLINNPSRTRKLTGDDNDTSLARAALGGPGKIARVETQGTVLVVTTAGADGMDTLGTDTGVGRLTTRLEGSLLPCFALLLEKNILIHCVF